MSIPALSGKDLAKLSKAVQSVSDGDATRLDGEVVDSTTKYSVYKVGSVIRIDLKGGQK